MIANLFLAFGLVLIVEGLAYALAPSLVERLLEALRQLDEGQRRMLGLVAVAIGLVFAWAAKHLGA
ncbi:DUF2065 domain-containing protein [Pseudooceanicola nanhaiensis]|uniref:DUF2065 domain-containing protein n=1 Tax=Pseudooceanicola nanhaiensis TaxID=375761 RepID=UPI001CD74FC6|nr:DUF2065 domain-containing protein [Pseudooceanicola nanhaiensis]MCA0922064.1 DUF2065 domain-containing protein [Pseudooceanicola nanhaiensis]